VKFSIEFETETVNESNYEKVIWISLDMYASEKKMFRKCVTNRQNIGHSSKQNAGAKEPSLRGVDIVWAYRVPTSRRTAHIRQTVYSCY